MAKVIDREKRARRRNFLEGITFVGPYFIGSLVFFIAPLAFTFFISLGNYQLKQGGNTFQFLGIKHYYDAFTTNLEFTKNLSSILIDTFINTPLIVIFSLVLAIILNKKFIGKGLFRTIFFLPFLLGTGYVLTQLLNLGTVDSAMESARSVMLPPELMAYLGSGLTNALMGFLSKITWVLWRSGVQIVLILSGLQSINRSLYESARVDNASEWEIFWKITLPMITPILLLVLVYTIIDSFSDPQNIMLSLFNTLSFKHSPPNFSLASALSIIYFSIVVIILGIIFKVTKRFVYTNN